MIKLVMADLDDTLIPFGASCASDHARAAIHALLDAGITFAPVTGRPPAAMEWMFPGDEACYATGAFANGQIVRIDGRTVQEVTIPASSLRKVAHFLDEKNADIWLCTYNPADADDVNLVTRHPERVLANPPETWGASVHGIVDDVEDRGYVKVNAQCACSREQMVRVRDELAAAVPELCFVFPSLTAPVIDVNAGNWDKGDSVRFVASQLGISMDEVVVFGDSDNDLPMIESVPNSVAVANASPAVAAAACWNIGPASEDAVADALLAIARTGTLDHLGALARLRTCVSSICKKVI